MQIGAFSNLLFLMVLVALSFCKIKVIKLNQDEDIPPRNFDYLIFNQYNKWNKDGLVNIKATHSCTLDYGQGYVLLEDIEIPTSFKAIEDDKIRGLKIGQDISTEDYIRKFDDTKCYFIGDVAEYHELLAYTAYFQDKQKNDIIPSLAYNIKNGPKSYESYFYRDDKAYRRPTKYNDNCHKGFSATNFFSSVYYNGIVDESCISNDFSSIPGYGDVYRNTTLADTWAQRNGTAPAIKEECADGSKFKPILKKNQLGIIQMGANLTTLKEVMLTYGPVIATIIRAKEDPYAEKDRLLQNYPGFTTATSSYDQFTKLFYGWDGSNLLFVNYDYKDGKFFNVIGQLNIRKSGTYYDYSGLGLKNIEFDTFVVKFAEFVGSSAAAVRTCLSLITAAVVLPALLLSF